MAPIAARLLSFPHPVNEVSARLVAGGVVIMCAVAIALDQPWLIALIAYGFVARVLTGPTLSPLGQLVTRVVAPLLRSPPQVPGTQSVSRRVSARSVGDRRGVGIQFHQSVATPGTGCPRRCHTGTISRWVRLRLRSPDDRRYPRPSARVQRHRSQPRLALAEHNGSWSAAGPRRRSGPPPRSAQSQWPSNKRGDCQVGMGGAHERVPDHADPQLCTLAVGSSLFSFRTCPGGASSYRRPRVPTPTRPARRPRTLAPTAW
jgi:hypothetical protein